jgi:hypothetical protein
LFANRANLTRGSKMVFGLLTGAAKAKAEEED